MNIDIIKNPKKNIDRNITVGSSGDVFNIDEVQEIKGALREHLLFIGLNNRNNVRNITLLGIGTTSNVNIDTKEIIRTALYSGSDKVILVHNHPSNNLEPSKADFHLTSITKELLKVFNIQLQDHIIVTEKDYISMEKTQNIRENSNNESINNMTRGLLIEENQRLKQQIYELQNKTKTGLKVISAEYVGNYNDTTVYNVEISLNETQEYVTLERKWNDKKANYKWEVFSNLILNDKENDYIIQTVSNNLPSMSIDSPKKNYIQHIVDSVEETITSISNLDNEQSFTVARVMENQKCVELHYDNGKAYLEYGTKVLENVWENQTVKAVNWFNLNLTDDEVLEYLNKEFDDYYLEGKEINFEC